ncbi:hypothetical protein F0P96_18045 [Hymenobacter busanensis]|uniref:Uncharacterized protein n=1 Tax=Hymenobacter busanensis TaxID=2607656 RepID=A0A7L4ZRQ5_9BACT|nr:hypothetical protein [Hymenobacter busanensis]KAA9327139.1 hypothetical protein F0P96_18045 [Hymenobacter busanensis]QHJ05804.1 hypothetical protein GUY19_00245 [Hymenobacter busanensis]
MTHGIKTGPYYWGRALPPLGFGLVFLQHLPLLAVGCFAFAALVASSYSGLEIDRRNHRYRNFLLLFGIRFGSWYALALATRVVLKAHSDTIRYHTRRGVARPWKRYEHLTLLLSIPDSIIGEAMEEFALRDRKYALQAGQQLAAALQIPFVVMDDV